MTTVLSTFAEKLPDATRLGPVHLKVTDLDRAVAVWGDLVGLSVHSHCHKAMKMGVDGRVLVSLSTISGEESSKGSLGLHHVALHLPSSRELALVVGRLGTAGHDFRAIDHTVTKAVYLSDHDGIGIELTLETPHRGRIEAVDGTLRAVSASNKIRTVGEPLDLGPLKVQIQGMDLRPPLPAGTTLGHVHLRVRDLERTNRFYADVIGFKPHLQALNLGMYDVGTSVRPHLIAFSNWVAAHAQGSRPGAAGLRFFTIEVPSRDDLTGLAARLEVNGNRFLDGSGCLETTDPDGNRAIFICSE